MELTILERIMLAGILPQEGNIVTLRIVQELKIANGFTEEEVKEHEIGLQGEGVGWKQEDVEYVKDIPIGPQAMKIIVESLEKLNSEEKLTAEFITLYDKFMDTTE